jgi:hypothetical protein
VVVGSLRFGEVILSGAVLGVWSTQPKGGWSELSAVACVEHAGAVVRAVRAGAGRAVEVHQRRVELEEATVGKRVAGGGGAQWTEVQQLTLARHKEKQRHGVSERRGRKRGAHRRGVPLIAARGGGRGGGNGAR